MELTFFLIMGRTTFNTFRISLYLVAFRLFCSQHLAICIRHRHLDTKSCSQHSRMSAICDTIGAQLLHYAHSLRKL
jgi:hypothetical protein